MTCVTPMDIRNEKTGMWNKVPCGNCYACLANRRNQWTFRMMQELKDSDSAYFVTLTYDPENIPLVKAWNWNIGTLDKSDVQKFNKKLRKYILGVGEEKWLKELKTTVSPKYRYFAVGEYGTLGDRPHYHVIMYNLPSDYVWENPINKKMYSEVLEDIWKKGIVDVEKVNKKVAHYCAKYTLESYIYNWFDNDVRQKPFAIMSRRPGIGYNYVNDDNKNYFNSNKISFTRVQGNYKQSLGRYYKDKIYPKAEGLEDPNSNRSIMQRGAINFIREQVVAEKRKAEMLGRDIKEIRIEQYQSSVEKIKRNLRKNKL